MSGIRSACSEKFPESSVVDLPSRPIVKTEKIFANRNVRDHFGRAQLKIPIQSGQEAQIFFKVLNKLIREIPSVRLVEAKVGSELRESPAAVLYVDFVYPPTEAETVKHFLTHDDEGRVVHFDFVNTEPPLAKSAEYGIKMDQGTVLRAILPKLLGQFLEYFDQDIFLGYRENIRFLSISAAGESFDFALDEAAAKNSVDWFEEVSLSLQEFMKGSH